jgi:hypothetical protein
MTLGDGLGAVNVLPVYSPKLREGSSALFSTLKSIGDALEITLAQLVMEASTIDADSSSLMKQKERKILTTEGGVQFQLLSRNVNVPFEFILNQWPPGTSTGRQLYTHEGEECGLLLEGELEVEVNGKCT